MFSEVDQDIYKKKKAPQNPNTAEHLHVSVLSQNLTILLI